MELFLISQTEKDGKTKPSPHPATGIQEILQNHLQPSCVATQEKEKKKYISEFSLILQKH